MAALSLGATTAPGAPDWNALGRGLDGKLIRPGDATYDSARRLFNPAFDGVRPAGVAYCANPSDVAECVNFARRMNVPLAVRSGGHSYAGWSTGTGLVVDVSRMSKVSHASGRATVGAGAKLVEADDRLAARGPHPRRDLCYGGDERAGAGRRDRRRRQGSGLTGDVMESVQMVTADGRLLTCDAGHNPDRYWASRGGGGGNLGVAVPSVSGPTHAGGHDLLPAWPWAKAAKALRAWQAVAHDPGRDVVRHARAAKRAGRGDRRALSGRQGGLRTAARPAGGHDRRDLFLLRAQTSYRHATMVMAGCSALSVAQRHQPGHAVTGPRRQLSRGTTPAPSRTWPTVRSPRAAPRPWSPRSPVPATTPCSWTPWAAPSAGSDRRPRPSRTGPPSTACSTTPTAPEPPPGPERRTPRCAPTSATTPT